MSRKRKQIKIKKDYNYYTYLSRSVAIGKFISSRRRRGRTVDVLLLFAIQIGPVVWLGTRIGAGDRTAQSGRQRRYVGGNVSLFGC
jgi:hypothetical protein